MNKKGISGWLSWAVFFLVVSIVAGLFGFTSVAGTSFTIAKWLAIIFVVLFIVALVTHTAKRG